MSKGQVNNASGTAKNNQAYTQGQTSDFINSIQGNVSPAFNAANTVGQNFALTGGFTPTQENQFVNQATSGITSTYNTLQNRYAQDRAKTGGLGTGGDASELARQLTQAQQSGTLAALTGLNQQENANKLSGAGLEAGLYNSTLNSILGAMGINVQSQGQEDNVLTELATNPSSNKSWWQNLAGGAGALGGVASGIAGWF